MQVFFTKPPLTSSPLKKGHHNSIHLRHLLIPLSCHSIRRLTYLELVDRNPSNIATLIKGTLQPGKKIEVGI